MATNIMEDKVIKEVVAYIRDGATDNKAPTRGEMVVAIRDAAMVAAPTGAMVHFVMSDGCAARSATSC
jgi:hypothetical protein